MIELLLLILLVLWFFNYIRIEGVPSAPNLELFVINGRTVTLFDILILVILSWVVSLLPSPLRQIGYVLGVLWILSVLGIFAFGGLSSLLVLAIIGGLLLYYILGFGRSTRVID